MFDEMFSYCIAQLDNLSFVMACRSIIFSIWKHLPDMIMDGKQDAFICEYGQKIFGYADRNPQYAEVFNQAMNSYSTIHTTLVSEALDGYDFSNIHHLCDIGGGQGHLLQFTFKIPSPSILELESVTKNKDLLWTSKMGVEDRCTYVIGDMYSEVPPADAYIMKMILHDWSDDECVKILSNIYRSSPNEGKSPYCRTFNPNSRNTTFFKIF